MMSLFATVTNIRDLAKTTKVADNFIPRDHQTLGILIGYILNPILALSGFAVIFYFIWGGYGWLTAGDKPEKVEEAQSRIKNALIGLALVASAFTLGIMVNQFFITGLTSDRPVAPIPGSGPSIP